MKHKSSVITLIEAIHSAMTFSPMKIYYNKKCIWDDTLSIDDGWLPLKDALDNFRNTHEDYERIIVTSAKIKIVEWHHSVIYLKGKVDKRKRYSNGQTI